MLLADEINRTPPKTQAALLEAMQERHVTIGEQTYPLPSPFFVIATQNPIEQEGTYNLPEAQLDRFLFEIRVPYPSAEEEREIMKQTVAPAKVSLDKVLDAESILRIQEVVPRVPTAEHVYDFALRLIRGLRPEEPAAPAYVKECLSWGPGPRAAQNLVLSARARALLLGRFHVTIDDVVQVSKPVLAHRLVTNFHADSEGITSVEILDRLLGELPRGEGGPHRSRSAP
jgi:MoxR-like ATPase